MEGLVDLRDDNGDITRHGKLWFDSLDEFYESCNTCSSDGDSYDHKSTKEDRSSDSFRGANTTAIIDRMWGWIDGIDKIPEVPSEVNKGNSSITKKWSDTDGYTMNMERAYEGFPFLRKKTKVSGRNSGRFVTVYVSLSLSAFVSAESILNKAFSVCAIVNNLTVLGYKLRIVVYLKAARPGGSAGTFKGRDMESVTLSVVVKDFSDTLNVPLVLNCISPWFLRYWFFLALYSNYKPCSGLGQPEPLVFKKNRDVIHIDAHECLTDENFKEFFESVKKRF